MSSEKFIVADCFDFFNRCSPGMEPVKKVEQFLLLLLKLWENCSHPVSRVYLCFWKRTFQDEAELLKRYGGFVFRCGDYGDFSKFCFDESVFLTNDKVFLQVLNLSRRIRVVKYLRDRMLIELDSSDLSNYGRYSKEDWIHYCLSKSSDKDGFPGVQRNSLALAHDFNAGKYHNVPSHRYWQRKAFFERRKENEIFLSSENPPESFDLDLFLDLCSAKFPRTLPLCLRIMKRREK